MKEQALDGGMNEEQRRAFNARFLLGRIGQPQDIANAVAFLASPLASFINGEVLNVNGGAVLCG